MRGLGCCLSIILGWAALSLLAAQETTPSKETPAQKAGAKDEQPSVENTNNKDSKKVSQKASKTEKKKGGVLLGDEKEQKNTKVTYGASFKGVLHIDANSQKEFTVQVQVPEPNPDGIQALNTALLNWERRKLEIARERNPVSRAQQLAQLQTDININLPRLQAGTIRYVSKDIKLRAADNLVVRTNILPIDYDDKGRPKKYTKKELEELRGDKNLPGMFKSEFEALRDGQIVTVYLAPGQANPVPKTKKDAKKGLVVLPPSQEALQETPEVVLIVILAEPKDR